jgi:non-heme chloroperoxidase
MLQLIVLVALSISMLHAQNTFGSSSPKQEFAPVEKDVKLEVLDWGGTGRHSVGPAFY